MDANQKAAEAAVTAAAKGTSGPTAQTMAATAAAMAAGVPQSRIDNALAAGRPGGWAAALANRLGG